MADLNSAKSAAAQGRAETCTATSSECVPATLGPHTAALTSIATKARDVVRMMRAERQMSGVDPSTPFIDQLAQNATRMEALAVEANQVAADIKASVDQFVNAGTPV